MSVCSACRNAICYITQPILTKFNPSIYLSIYLSLSLSLSLSLYIYTHTRAHSRTHACIQTHQIYNTHTKSSYNIFQCEKLISSSLLATSKTKRCVCKHTLCTNCHRVQCTQIASKYDVHKLPRRTHIVMKYNVPQSTT